MRTLPGHDLTWPQSVTALVEHFGTPDATAEYLEIPIGTLYSYCQGSQKEMRAQHHWRFKTWCGWPLSALPPCECPGAFNGWPENYPTDEDMRYEYILTCFGNVYVPTGPRPSVDEQHERVLRECPDALGRVWMKGHPELLRRMAAEQWAALNHTWAEMQPMRHWIAAQWPGLWGRLRRLSEGATLQEAAQSCTVRQLKHQLKRLRQDPRWRTQLQRTA